VQLGLTPSQAIVAATARPAELMGLKDMGTLSAGKSADFLVLTANPLENIRNTREIERVYLKGTLLNRDALRLANKKERCVSITVEFDKREPLLIRAQRPCTELLTRCHTLHRSKSVPTATQPVIA